MRNYLAAVPHVAVTGVSSTYITIAVSIVAVVLVFWWKDCPKAVAGIVCILATAAVCSTAKFGPWFELHLNDITDGFLGRN
jgi:hypothetical protein